MQNGIIKKTVSHNGAVYVRLTQKGYTFAATHLCPQEKHPLYTFRRDRGVNHKISDHDYYNFVFVWDWIQKNPLLLNKNIQIYDDSNITECTVSFIYDHKRIVISPDILIFRPDTMQPSFRVASFVESDAGGETYRQIFEKIVEYGLLFVSGINQNAISHAEIFFIFHSEKRAVKLLYEKVGILQFFDFANSTRKVKRIPIDLILTAFTKHKIFYSSYHHGDISSPLLFIEYPLKNLLLERRPEWKIYS